MLNNEVRCIFLGWMYVVSFGFYVVEYLVYDVWLINCKLVLMVLLLEDYDGFLICGFVVEGEDLFVGLDDGFDMGLGIFLLKFF